MKNEKVHFLKKGCKFFEILKVKYMIFKRWGRLKFFGGYI